LTNSFQCNIGLRLGDETSTILFNLNINDLFTYLKEAKLKGIFITGHVPNILCILFTDAVAN